VYWRAGLLIYHTGGDHGVESDLDRDRCGRYFHAFCAISDTGEVLWERRHVVNTTGLMRRALEALRRFCADRPVTFASEEAAGNASALMRLLAERGETVYLTQPLRVHRFISPWSAS